eukprot:CFRG1017T1
MQTHDTLNKTTTGREVGSNSYQQPSVNLCNTVPTVPSVLMPNEDVHRRSPKVNRSSIATSNKSKAKTENLSGSNGEPYWDAPNVNGGTSVGVDGRGTWPKLGKRKSTNMLDRHSNPKDNLISDAQYLRVGGRQLAGEIMTFFKDFSEAVVSAPGALRGQHSVQTQNGTDHTQTHAQTQMPMQTQAQAHAMHTNANDNNLSDSTKLSIHNKVNRFNIRRNSRELQASTQAVNLLNVPNEVPIVPVSMAMQNTSTKHTIVRASREISSQETSDSEVAVSLDEQIYSQTNRNDLYMDAKRGSFLGASGGTSMTAVKSSGPKDARVSDRKEKILEGITRLDAMARRKDKHRTNRKELPTTPTLASATRETKTHAETFTSICRDASFNMKAFHAWLEDEYSVEYLLAWMDIKRVLDEGKEIPQPIAKQLYEDYFGSNSVWSICLPVEMANKLDDAFGQSTVYMQEWALIGAQECLERQLANFVYMFEQLRESSSGGSTNIHTQDKNSLFASNSWSGGVPTNGLLDVMTATQLQSGLSRQRK